MPSRLPDRPLRRQPYEHEVRAAVDYAALDLALTAGHDDLSALFFRKWLPEQMQAVYDGIVFTKSGKVRERVTAADLARVRAPAVGAEELEAVLLQAARAGAANAAAEMGAQGIDMLAVTDEALLARIRPHAQATADLIAEGVSLASQRRAVQLSAGRTAAEIGEQTIAYLGQLKHAWEVDQLGGAVAQATNAGRFEVFSRVPSEAPLEHYASELLDAATCDECAAIDGAVYGSLDEAMVDYPTGGYVDCAGGPRCRGTVVAVLPEL